MKTKRNILCLLLPVMMLGLEGCKSNIALAPEGTVPKRKALTYDAFGGYITIQTVDNFSFSGELIGIRNDSLVVLADSAVLISSKNISKARIIAYSPNQHGAGILFALPNLLLMGAGCEDCGSPVVLAILLTAIDAIGVSFAVGTENRKENYHDWAAGRNELIKYSRFPHGIPQSINVSGLKGRKIKSVNTNNRPHD